MPVVSRFFGTVEAARRRQDALGLVVKRVARAIELGFAAESRERSSAAIPTSGGRE